MKECRTKDGPYPLRLHYEVAEIDDICRDALLNAKLLPTDPQPIKVDRFLEKYFQVVVDYPYMDDGIMGSTVFNTKGAVTGFLISSKMEQEGTPSAERRVRSTLAHEGGHGLLHPKLFIEEGTQAFSVHTACRPRQHPSFFAAATTSRPPLARHLIRASGGNGRPTVQSVAFYFRKPSCEKPSQHFSKKMSSGRNSLNRNAQPLKSTWPRPSTSIRLWRGFG